MKIYLLLFILGCTAFIACRKEYTCFCNGGFSGHDSSTVVVKAANEQRARTKCLNMSTPNADDGIGCDLRK